MRWFDSIPALLSWTTLFLVVFLSWQEPVWIAVFIILFDIYWLLKAIYFSLHLRSSFSKMRDNLRINWLRQLSEGKLSARPDKSGLGLIPRSGTPDSAMRNLGLKKLDILAKTICETNCSPDQSPATIDLGQIWQSVYHLVILPMANEPYEVIEETFDSLAGANYPKDKLMVVLAVEESGGNAANNSAMRILARFGAVLPNCLITRHPANLAGEIPGKGSNETWAAKEAKDKIIDRLKIPYEKIIVSVFDVDTQINPEYFGCLAYHFLTAENPQRSSYQPIPLFTNNIYKAPALARIISFSATFWQMMQQSRPERLTTFSSHAMPFKALAEIGYWQKDIVSEDSRIFWQCYFHYNGDWRVVPLFFPVFMDANVAPTFWGTMINIYKQQRRWAWGAENIPFLLRGFVKNKLIPLKTKIYWSFNVIESFHSWATNSIIIFALGWLPIFIGKEGFGETVMAYNLPGITREIMFFASIGIASSAILSIIILPPRPEGIRLRHYVWYLLQWLLLPITLIIFGAVPALDAQTRLMLGGKFRLGFWVTPKSRNRE